MSIIGQSVRLATDPRMVVTAVDCEAIERGAEYTPTDLALIQSDSHPYFVVAS